MEIIKQAHQLRPLLKEYSNEGSCLGFVPTMGNLHAGHLALVDAAAEQCDRVIVSIKIAYPRKSFAPLIHISGIGTIGVEEGLYWILQKEGWLYEGYVEWIKK